MGPALLLIAQLYRVEERAREWRAEERLAWRQRESRPILEKLHSYLLEMQAEVLPKSPEGRAIRYTTRQRGSRRAMMLSHAELPTAIRIGPPTAKDATSRKASY